MEQSGGEDSTNYQAAGDISVYQGNVTVSEVRAIVHDAIRANMLDLRSEAQRIVEERIAIFSDRYVERVAREGDAVLAAAQDPDVQFTITQAGIGYARTGDDELGDVLLDLLADRAKAPTRSLLAVVINDAVTVTSRLTDGEIAILTVFWRLCHTVSNRMNNLEALEDFVKREIAPLITRLPRGEASYRHLQALGCANIQISEVPWMQPWLLNYGGLFSKGFELAWVPAPVMDALSGSESPFLPALRNPSLVQVNAMTDAVIDGWADKYPDFVVQDLKRLKQTYQMDENDVLDVLAEIDPAMRELPTIWKSTPLAQLSLSAVGMAVAHANFRRLTGDDSTPLSIWINEDGTGG